MAQGGEITIDEERIGEVLQVIASLQGDVQAIDVGLPLLQGSGSGCESMRELSCRIQALAGSMSDMLMGARRFIADSSDAFKTLDEAISRDMLDVGNGRTERG